MLNLLFQFHIKEHISSLLLIDDYPLLEMQCHYMMQKKKIVPIFVASMLRCVMF